jgi:hypothetical protein
MKPYWLDECNTTDERIEKARERVDYLKQSLYACMPVEKRLVCEALKLARENLEKELACIPQM